MKSLAIVVNYWTNQVHLIFNRKGQRCTTYYRKLNYLLRTQRWINRFYLSKSFTIRPFLGSTCYFGIVIEKVEGNKIDKLHKFLDVGDLTKVLERCISELKIHTTKWDLSMQELIHDAELTLTKLKDEG